MLSPVPGLPKDIPHVSTRSETRRLYGTIRGQSGSLRVVLDHIGRKTDV